MRKLILLIFFNISLFAHPHYFIDVDLNIKDNKIFHVWKFDKINSKLLLFDFDKNKNKILEKDEQEAFYKTQLEPLRKNNFNLFVEVNGKEYTFPKLDDFKVEYKKRRIVISFITKVKKGECTMCTIDPTVYMAFKLNNVNTTFKAEIQKSAYDFCLGVSK